jgi:hypothetical protein
MRPRRTAAGDLSEAAIKAYKAAAKHGDTLQTRDWKDEYLDGAKELAEKGWGTYSVSNFNDKDHHYLWIKRFHKLYTHIKGRHAYNVRISQITNPEADAYRVTDGALVIADLEGADIGEGRATFNGPALRIAVREPGGGTDFEHDSMYLAQLEISNPRFLRFDHNGTICFTGTITQEESFLLPFGADPFAEEGSEGEDGSECTYEQCVGKDAHRIGPFLPRPSVNLSGTNVVLEISTNFEIVNSWKDAD